MSTVTKWERWVEPANDKPGYWAHNHLENGRSDADSPTPFRDASGSEFKSQNDSWARGTWRKSFGTLAGPNHVFVTDT